MNHSLRSRPVGRRALIGGLAGLAVATGAGSSWAVDRYLIEHVQIDDVATYEAEQGGTTAPSGGGTITADGYTSDPVDLSVTTHRQGTGDDTVTWFVADVRTQDPTVIRAAFAQNRFGTNITENPSAIAARQGAVLAVNGDYYGFRDTGIVIRNGVLYRDAGAREGLALYRDGRVACFDETATTGKQLVAEGVWQTLSFGPALVKAGTAVSGVDRVEVDTNVGNHSIQGSQPRTGIGAVSPDRFLLVVVDGRSPGYSRGVTLPEFADLFVDLGCEVAYNLDGGGSATMYFNEALVNDPLGRGRERGTSDILWIAG